MKTFNLKRIINLCQLQIKEMPLWMELVAPICGIGMLVILTSLEDSWTDGLDTFLSISINIRLMYSLYNSFELFLQDKQGFLKISLPATNLEKYVSIYLIVFLRSLFWFVLTLLVAGIFTLIRMGFYEQTAAEIWTTPLEHFDIEMLTISLALFIPFTQYIIGRDLEPKKKMFNTAFIAILIGSMLGLSFLMPDDTPDTIDNLIFGSVSLLSFVAGYFCFKQAKPRYFKYML